MTRLMKAYGSRRLAHHLSFPGQRAGWSAIRTMVVLTLVVGVGGSVIAYFVLGDGVDHAFLKGRQKSPIGPQVSRIQLSVPEVPLSGSPLGPLPIDELGAVTPLPLDLLEGFAVPPEAAYVEQPVLTVPDVLVGLPAR